MKVRDGHRYGFEARREAERGHSQEVAGEEQRKVTDVRRRNQRDDPEESRV